MLNNLLRCSTPIIILFFLCLNINCKKDAESSIQPCSIPALKDYLSTDWVLTTTTWNASDAGKLYEDCYDIDCVHFNLSFTSDSIIVFPISSQMKLLAILFDWKKLVPI